MTIDELIARLAAHLRATPGALPANLFRIELYDVARAWRLDGRDGSLVEIAIPAGTRAKMLAGEHIPATTIDCAVRTDSTSLLQLAERPAAVLGLVGRGKLSVTNVNLGVSLGRAMKAALDGAGA